MFFLHEFKLDKVALGNINILETCITGLVHGIHCTHREHTCSWKFPDDVKQRSRKDLWKLRWRRIGRSLDSLTRTKINEGRVDFRFEDEFDSNSFLIRVILNIYCCLKFFFKFVSLWITISIFHFHIRVCTISKLIIIGLLHSMIQR